MPSFVFPSFGVWFRVPPIQIRVSDPARSRWVAVTPGGILGCPESNQTGVLFSDTRITWVTYCFGELF